MNVRLSNIDDVRCVFLYLTVVHSGEDGLFVTQLKLEVHEGQFVCADLKSIIGEENS